MTAATITAPLTRRDPRLKWLVVGVVVVAIGLLAMALDVPYLGSFVDWLINVVPRIAYLFVRYAVPIAFGALCGIMCERSGVVTQ